MACGNPPKNACESGSPEIPLNRPFVFAIWRLEQERLDPDRGATDLCFSDGAIVNSSTTSNTGRACWPTFRAWPPGASYAGRETDTHLKIRDPNPSALAQSADGSQIGGRLGHEKSFDERH